MIKSPGHWSNAYLSYIHRSQQLTPAITELMARIDATKQPPWNANKYTLNEPTVLQVYTMLYVTLIHNHFVYHYCQSIYNYVITVIISLHLI